ncbi:MAG TPA: CRISPR system precrRNA processing endoribonuclease RAMP protein Cas6 [Terriglobia bacterium]|nr:CRISPR system precrRNA processing endoribonuclease RAMP protein Cas6 [Terriglobia bacterium]
MPEGETGGTGKKLARELESFAVARFRLRLRVLERLALPGHMGSALRGGFGRIFRRVACTRGCREACQRPAECAYGYVFETRTPPESQILRSVESAPRPFALEPPGGAQPAFDPGESLELGLVLVGRAMDYLPYFIYAFRELGRAGLGRWKGKFRLEEVAALPLVGDPAAIYREGRDHPASDRIYRLGLAQLPPPPADGSWLTVEFLSPTQVQYEGAAVAPREFHVLFRSLLRRVNFLNYFHCGGRLMEEPQTLIDDARTVRTEHSALRWEAWERYSFRQARRVPMGGYVGQVSFRGRLQPFWPWLALGQWVHVGKGATFGLGQYQVRTGW